MLDARNLIGTHDALFIALDTLRYDVARDALDEGRTPNLAAMLPGGAWEERHSPGNFTYAARHAFFAGYLPTPIAPGPHPRRPSACCLRRDAATRPGPRHHLLGSRHGLRRGRILRPPRQPSGGLDEPGFENALRETPCGSSTCGCHIGYVHMDELRLYEVFGEGVLERISIGRV